MKLIIQSKIIILLIILPTLLSANAKQTMVMNTPTAFTIPKGTFHLSFLGYDQGGMEFKTFLGLHNIFYLGVSLDVQSALGRDKPEFNVPGVIAKLKFTDGAKKFPIAIAAGYDSFFVGYDGVVEENPKNELDRVIYGPFLVFTGSIYLFDSEQFLSLGIRMPTQPYHTPDKTSYFTSFDIPLGDYFRFELGVERLYWNFRKHHEWLYSTGLKYFYDNVGFEFALIMQEHMRPNRILRVDYRGKF